MMSDLNQAYEKDRNYFGKLQDYFADNRGLPSYSYMQKMFSLGSKDTVSKFVSRMKLQGFLDVAPDKKLIPGRRFFERPLSNSTVQAGALTAAYSEGEEQIFIDEILIHKPSITTLVTVRGESMKDIGIMEGDTVVVEKRPLANIGDIVVAIVDNVFTIKTLGQENGNFVLIPANKDFSTIRPKEGFEIFGIVVGHFRSYR
jgi:repressor LexA